MGRKQKYKIELTRYVNDDLGTISWQLYVWNRSFWSPRILGSHYFFNYKPTQAEVDTKVKELIEAWESREPTVTEGAYLA